MMGRWSTGRSTTRRRTQRIKSNALIRRLRGDRRAMMRRGRNHAQLTPELFNRSLKRPGVQLALLGVFCAALGIGAVLSHPVVRQLERAWGPSATRLESISVQGHQRLSAGDVAAATGLAERTPVGSIDVVEVIANLEAHPWIRRAQALTLPAGHLLVGIEERVPAVAVASRNVDSGVLTWQFVDRDGIAFAVADPVDIAGLPRLHTDRAPALGVRDPRLVEAIAVTRRFPMLALGDESLETPQSLELPSEATDDGWVLHFEAPKRRVILGREALDTRLERLALLLDADLESTRAAEVIDLRFADRAILRSASGSF